MEDHVAYYQAILLEILQEKVKRSPGRRTPRGVKRKMCRYPIRNRYTGTLKPLDLARALEILK